MSHFCHLKQTISSSLPPHPHMQDTGPGPSPGVVAQEGVGRTAGTRHRDWGPVHGAFSRDTQNNGERALSHPPSAQLFAAPEPLLSPSGRLGHLAAQADAVCGGQSLLTVPVRRACVTCSLSSLWSGREGALLLSH